MGLFDNINSKSIQKEGIEQSLEGKPAENNAGDQIIPISWDALTFSKPKDANEFIVSESPQSYEIPVEQPDRNVNKGEASSVSAPSNDVKLETIKTNEINATLLVDSSSYHNSPVKEDKNRVEVVTSDENSYQNPLKEIAEAFRTVSELAREASKILKGNTQNKDRQDDVSHTTLEQAEDIVILNGIVKENRKGVESLDTEDKRLKNADQNSEQQQKDWNFRIRGFLYPVSILRKQPDRTNDNTTSEKSRLQAVLDSLAVKAKVEKVIETPMMTAYGLVLQRGTRVSSITSRKEELAFSLHSEIEFQVPLKGTSFLGILAYKQKRNRLYLRTLVESEEFLRNHARIPILLGMDMNGIIQVADLTKLGSILVVGGTGSGKSTFLHGFLLSALLTKQSDEMKLILADTRNVEFSMYNGLPNLLIPIAVGAERVVETLRWAAEETKKRLVEGYSSIKRPAIVIIVDELSDVMGFHKEKAEEAIIEIATYSINTGIYLILASQWISQDIITNEIKTKIPACVAFRISSGKASQTLFGIKEAERLLGDGDMLFFSNADKGPSRIQGVMVDDQEIKNVVSHLKRDTNNSLNDSYDEILQNEIMKRIDAFVQKENEAPIIESYDVLRTGDEDEYFADAARMIVTTGRSSLGMLQRIFKISFNRAARIMDALSEAGVVGPAKGTEPRTILMDEIELEHYLRTR